MDQIMPYNSAIPYMRSHAGENAKDKCSRGLEGRLEINFSPEEVEEVTTRKSIWRCALALFSNLFDAT